MGNQASVAIEKGRAAAEDAVGRAVGPITKCMSRDASQADDTLGAAPVTFGLHGKKIRIDDMRVGGDGVALACEPIAQDKGYFECKIVAAGQWSVGVSRREAHAHSDLGQDGKSWCLRAEQCECAQGDMLGVAYDQSCMPTMLKFYKNGELLAGTEVTGIRGEVFPAVCVSGGAMVECEFDGDNGFAYPPPSGFSGIVASRSLM